MPIDIADIAEVIYYTGDSTPPLTVLKPANFMPGEILVLVIAHDAIAGGLIDLTGPSGWIDEGNYNNVLGGTAGKVWSHVYDSGDPSSWDFGYNNVSSMAAGLVRITGGDTTPTITVTSASGSDVSGVVDSPSVTPTGINDLLVCALGDICQGNAFSQTDPSGMDNRGQAQLLDLYMAVALASKQLTDGNATGAKTWTAISPQNKPGGTLSIAIKSSGFLDPDPPPNPPPPLVPPWMLRELVEARQQPVVGHQYTPVVKEMLSGGASGASVTLTTDAKTAVDDILVLFQGNNFYTAGVMATPTGTAGTWTNRATGDNGSNSAHMKIWTRPVTVAGAQTVTCSPAVDEEHTCHLFVISGADITGIIDGTGAGSNGASSTTHTCPSVTTATPNALLLVGAQSTSLGNYTIPTTLGMLKKTEVDVGGFCTGASACEVLGIGAATGTRVFTISAAGAFATCSIAIKAPQLATPPVTTSCNAECATFIMAAQDSGGILINASAIDAAIGMTVSDPSDNVQPIGDVAPAAVIAQDVTGTVSTLADVASWALASNDVAVSIGINAENVTFTFAANDATVSTSTGTNALAEVVTFTFTANDPTVSLVSNAENVTFTLSAQDATAMISAMAEAVAFTMAAQDAALSIKASADVATWTFSANDATVLTGTLINAEVATLAMVANDSTLAVLANAEVVTWTLAANNATVQIGSNVNAESAAFTLAALDAQMKVNAFADVALVSWLANDATVSYSQAGGSMAYADRAFRTMESMGRLTSGMNDPSRTYPSIGSPDRNTPGMNPLNRPGSSMGGT